MSKPTEAAAPETKAKRPRTSISRPSSDASRFHMSKEAVDRSVAEPLAWSDLKCAKHLAQMRWGDWRNVVCPHCNTGAEHYFWQEKLRWKCKACGSRFSVTSSTVFAGRRIPLQVLIAAVHLWASGAAGQPALELRRMLAIKGYNTAFTLVSRLREGLIRGFNVGLISGLVEMDGAHASGRRASEKRGRPLPVRKTSEDEARDDALLTSAARSKKKRDEKKAALAAGGHVVNPDNGAAFPAARRIVFTCRRKSGQKGKGACMTRIGVGMGETPDVAQALAEAYVAVPESILATDTGSAFFKLGKEFQLHLQVNHSETLVGPNGEHVNNAEGFTARQDRSEKGVYLNIEPKYLSDYVAETAFREDHRRLAPGAQADRALGFALSVGPSHFWSGFTHGQHRGYELLATGRKPAPSSGPMRGRSPVPAENGRLPR
jgi:hypothetical protein